MSVSERNIGMLQRETILTVTRIRLDDVIWKYSQREKLQFFNFLLLFSLKEKAGKQDGGQFIFLWEELSTFLFFVILTRKRKWNAAQNSLTSFPLIWNNLASQLLDTSLQQSKLARYHRHSFNLFWQTLEDVLWQSFKSYETWKWNLLDWAKKSSDAELIIKFASSSVGEGIFRDLRSEIYNPSEEKLSADRENGRLIALK